MNSVVSPEIREITEAVHYSPAVSLILPFDPKMNLKTEVAHSLKLALAKVEQELSANYNGEVGKLVMRKLQALTKDLNFNTHKRSIAIYVSPVFEKVLYLDISVEERIVVDESFEIRDLVYSKKQMHKYLVLLLGGNESRIYLGNTSTFVRIVTDTPGSVHAYANDIAERVANFSDKDARKEALLDKFLHHMDNALDIVLKAYHLPLFVVGTPRMLGHFKKLTKHSRALIASIEGNYEEATIPELKLLLAPYVADWQKVLQTDLINKLEEAAGNKKLATGMKAVWHEAMHHKGRLLVVEKNYMYPAEHGNKEDTISKAIKPYNKFSYIKDAVDDVIEKVLEDGGDVEFVDPGVLNDYNHIALVQYY